MQKGHAIATHERTVRGRPFSARFIATVMMPLIEIEQFVRLRHSPASSDVSQK